MGNIDRGPHRCRLSRQANCGTLTLCKLKFNVISAYPDAYIQAGHRQVHMCDNYQGEYHAGITLELYLGFSASDINEGKK